MVLAGRDPIVLVRTMERMPRSYSLEKPGKCDVFQNELVGIVNKRK